LVNTDIVRRRPSDAGIKTAISCHTFRATGITDYLTNGGYQTSVRDIGPAPSCSQLR